ncbi:MAG: glycosyltransferase family 4 protein [Armatimonadota bacterium]
MKILVLTQWYPPEPQRLLFDISEVLIKMGHEVTVLTGFPNWPNGRVYPGYRQSLLYKETLEGVPVCRVPLFPDHSRSGLRRAINNLSFAVSASVIGPWTLKRHDVVFALHPPISIAMPAFVLSRLWRVPFVLNIQDMWPETLLATGLLAKKSLVGLISKLCICAYKHASRVIVISQGFKLNLLAKGVLEQKVDVIPNWVDTNFYRPVEPDMDKAKSLGLDAGKFNLVFAGMMGPSQGLGTVLEAASLLREQSDIRFVFVGDGLDYEPLREKASAMGLENVLFLGRHPESAMNDLFSLADALLVNLRDEPLFEITIPHKILAYMAVGKPIIAAVRGDAADVVRNASAGITCEPGNAKALAEAVEKMYHTPDDQRAAMGIAGRKSACDDFSREHLVARLADCMAQAKCKR